MRKTAVGLVCAALLAFVSAAAAEPYLWAWHGSYADIVEGRAVYDTAEFSNVGMEVYDDGVTATGAHANATGTLTLEGGNYTFRNGTGEETVSGMVKTFALVSSEVTVGEEGVGYGLVNDSGETVAFLGAADTGLRGKEVRWAFPSLPALDGKATVPAFRSTAEQLASYVPYVELIRSGTNITGVKWRLVDPKAPNKALTLASDVRVQVRISGQSTYRGKSQAFPAGSAPEGTETLETPLAEAELYNVQVRLRNSETGKGLYRWNFTPRGSSDAGVEDWGDLKTATTFTLKAGESQVVKLLLKDGFSTPYRRKSIVVGDESLLSAELKDTETVGSRSWNRFELKGLKPGKTSVTIVYVDDQGKRYGSLPVEVWVTDENGAIPQNEGKSSGGGGCSAGFWGLGLLALLAIPLRRRR